MSAQRCRVKEGVWLRRHKWGADRKCVRCHKTRNPAAGEKMFRVYVPKKGKKA